MSSVADMKISSAPNLEKFEGFLKDPSYRELIEYCVSFNTRLCLERRLRLPFLDPQTGVAQNHCQLFVDKRQRMPGFRQGQIYTYPSARWRKSRRQYLSKMYRFPDRPFQALRKDHERLVATGSLIKATASPTVTLTGYGGGDSSILNDSDFNSILIEESSSLGAAGGDTSDSKDSQQQQKVMDDHLPKDWPYSTVDINDNDSFEEPKSPPDDEYDYDPRYGSKKRRKRKPSKKMNIKTNDSIGPGRRRGSGAGRGRKLSNAIKCTTPTLGDNSLSGIDSLDSLSSSDVNLKPTPSHGPGRRPRGASSSTRGRRRTKLLNTTGGDDPLSPSLHIEPPSFETAAAAVGGVIGSDLTSVIDDHNIHLRNYRKYL